MRQWIISASVLTAAVCVLRTAMKGKISPIMQYALWALVLVRLLIPVSFSGSAFSVLNYMENTERN